MPSSLCAKATALLFALSATVTLAQSTAAVQSPNSASVATTFKCPADNGTTTAVVQNGYKETFLVLCDSTIPDTTENAAAVYRPDQQSCQTSCIAANAGDDITCTGITYDPTARGDNCIMHSSKSYNQESAPGLVSLWLLDRSVAVDGTATLSTTADVTSMSSSAVANPSPAVTTTSLDGPNPNAWTARYASSWYTIHSTSTHVVVQATTTYIVVSSTTSDSSSYDESGGYVSYPDGYVSATATSTVATPSSASSNAPTSTVTTTSSSVTVLLPTNITSTGPTASVVTPSTILTTGPTSYSISANSTTLMLGTSVTNSSSFATTAPTTFTITANSTTMMLGTSVTNSSVLATTAPTTFTITANSTTPVLGTSTASMSSYLTTAASPTYSSTTAVNSTCPSAMTMTMTSMMTTTNMMTTTETVTKTETSIITYYAFTTVSGTPAAPTTDKLMPRTFVKHRRAGY